MENPEINIKSERSNGEADGSADIKVVFPDGKAIEFYRAITDDYRKKDMAGILPGSYVIYIADSEGRKNVTDGDRIQNLYWDTTSDVSVENFVDKAKSKHEDYKDIDLGGDSA